MKSLLCFLLLTTCASAQTITLGTIAKTTYCVGDTMYVPYTATGTFASDNHFFVQLIYPNDMFSAVIQAPAPRESLPSH